MVGAVVLMLLVMLGRLPLSLLDHFPFTGVQVDVMVNAPQRRCRYRRCAVIRVILRRREPSVVGVPRVATSPAGDRRLEPGGAVAHIKLVFRPDDVGRPRVTWVVSEVIYVVLYGDETPAAFGLAHIRRAPGGAIAGGAAI